MQAKRVVPLVDLALRESNNVDVAARLSLLVMDHLDKVELFVALLVMQTGALIDELDFASSERHQLTLHVEVVE